LDGVPDRVSALWIINICRKSSKAAIIGIDGEFKAENEATVKLHPGIAETN
jgi:hypothetical protein